MQYMLYNIFSNYFQRIEFDNNDFLVADAFSTYWGSFATTGNSSYNLGSFPQWPLYADPSWSKLIIDAPQPIVSDNYLEDICDFWDSLNIYVVMSSSNDVSTATSTDVSSATSTASEVTTTGSSSCVRGNVGLLFICIISLLRFTEL